MLVFVLGRPYVWKLRCGFTWGTHSGLVEVPVKNSCPLCLPDLLRKADHIWPLRRNSWIGMCLSGPSGIREVLQKLATTLCHQPQSFITTLFERSQQQGPRSCRTPPSVPGVYIQCWTGPQGMHVSNTCSCGFCQFPCASNCSSPLLLTLNELSFCCRWRPRRRACASEPGASSTKSLKSLAMPRSNTPIVHSICFAAPPQDL